jgi:hypothetical protein
MSRDVTKVDAGLGRTLLEPSLECIDWLGVAGLGATSEAQ